MSQPFVNSSASWNGNEEKKQSWKENHKQKYEKGFLSHQERIINNQILYSMTQNENIHGIHTEQQIRHEKKNKITNTNTKSETKNKYEWTESENRKKNFQLLLRYSLKKGQTAKVKSRQLMMEKQENESWLAKSLKKVVGSQGGGFPQLQGKKCKINTSLESKFNNANKLSKNKNISLSQSKYHSNHQKWIQSLKTQQPDQPVFDQNSFITLGMAAKRKQTKQQKNDLYYIIQTKRNKINKDKVILYSNNCFIVDNNSRNPENHDFRNQIKAIKKDRQFMKRIPKLQCLSHEKNDTFTQPKIFCLRSGLLKNSFPKNFYYEEIDQASQSLRKPRQYKDIMRIIKKDSNIKTLQNLKISGWEVNGNLDHESFF